MAPQHDANGLLTGTPVIDLERSAESLAAIERDVKDIKAAFMTANVRQQAAMKPNLSKPAAAPRARDSQGRFVATATPAAPKKRTETATPKTAQPNPRKPASPAAAKTPPADDKTPSATANTVNAAVSRLANAVTALGSGTTEADPSVKAAQEVAEPMKRSYDAIFGNRNGGDRRKDRRWQRIFGELSLFRKESSKLDKKDGNRRKDRWPQRIFGDLRLFRNESSVFYKEATRRLKGIEGKPVADGKGGLLAPLFALLAALLGPLAKLAGGLPTLIKGLPLLPKLLGGFGKTAGGGTKPGGQPKKTGKLLAKGGGLLKGLAKRVPWLAALWEGGNAISDQLGDEFDPNLSHKEKVNRRYTRGGDFAAKMGGMVGGAAAGAQLGGMAGMLLGPVGAAVGTAVGGFLGGVGGFMLGDQFGEKIGAWTQSLVDADIPGKIAAKWGEFTGWASEHWDKATVSMGKAWTDVTGDMSKWWDSSSKAMSLVWDGTTGSFKALGNAFIKMMKDKFGIDLPAIGESVKAAAAQAVNAVQAGADQANEWVKNKTGVDVAGGVQSGVNAVGGLANKTASAAGGALDSVKSGVSTGIDAAGNAIGGIKSRFSPNATFDKTAPVVTKRLMDDYHLTAEQAAGIVGNLGHESAGLKAGIQEKNPIRGRGGLGWAQWTGPRRKAFENYLAETGQTADNPEANYGFLKRELATSHKSALTAVRNSHTPEESMMAFEKHYEAAGVKHYGSRQGFTDRALALIKRQPSSSSDVATAMPPSVMPSSTAQSLWQGGESKGIAVPAGFESFAGSARVAGKVAAMPAAPSIPRIPPLKPPAIADAPPMQMPLNSQAARPSPVVVQVNPGDAAQDVSDRDIAHLATGGISRGGFNQP